MDSSVVYLPRDNIRLKKFIIFKKSHIFVNAAKSKLLIFRNNTNSNDFHAIKAKTRLHFNIYIRPKGLLPTRTKKLLFSAIICLFLDLMENHSGETLTVWRRHLKCLTEGSLYSLKCRRIISVLTVVWFFFHALIRLLRGFIMLILPPIFSRLRRAFTSMILVIFLCVCNEAIIVSWFWVNVFLRWACIILILAQFFASTASLHNADFT